MTQREKSLILDEIVSVEDAGMQQTYDFTVPNTHCFIANGVLVHNSGEMEEVADLVFLCHWAYKYTHDEEERNKYWVHIAKNRDGRTGIIDNLWYIPEFLKIKEGNYAGESAREPGQKHFGIFGADEPEVVQHGEGITCGAEKPIL